MLPVHVKQIPLRLVILLAVLVSFISGGEQNHASAGDSDGCVSSQAVRCAVQFPGADISAKANAAFASCRDACTVHIPAGHYNLVSTTLSIPVHTNGLAALWLDPGAVIHYTGSGYAIEALGVGEAYANISVYGGGVVSGTPTATGGLHLRALNKFTVTGITFSGFAAGDGIFNEGANTGSLIDVEVIGNKIGIHNEGAVISEQKFSANSVTMFGGQVASNMKWGVYEDGRLSGLVGPNISNSYIGVAFQQNGADGDAESGHVFVQAGDTINLIANHFEFFQGTTGRSSLVVGDATFQAKNINIRGNWFGSVGASSSIILANSIFANIDGNNEAAAVHTFLDTLTGAKATYLGSNAAAMAKQYLTGHGTYTSRFMAGAVSFSGNLRAPAYTSNSNSTQGLFLLPSETVVRSPKGGTTHLQDAAGIEQASFKNHLTKLNGALQFNRGSILNQILTGRAALPFGTIAAKSGQEKSMRILGASTVNFGVFCSPNGDLRSSGISWAAWVSSRDNVVVRLTNQTESPVAPAEVIWGCTVNQ